MVFEKGNLRKRNELAVNRSPPRFFYRFLLYCNIVRTFYLRPVAFCSVLILIALRGPCMIMEYSFYAT